MKRLAATLATIWRMSIPYFRSEDRWPGRALLGAVIAIELSIVAITVILNQWYNRFYNTLQDRNWEAFVSAILFFCVIAAIYTVLAVYQNYLNLWLQIRWRRWMTQTYLRQWLNTANHYRMQLLGDAADNPDQRIADDLQMFVQNTLSIGLGLLNSCVTLGSFVVILWTLSENAPLHLFGASLCHSRLSGLGGAVLCGDRHRAHAFDRLAAYSAQLPATALRGRFPLQPGAQPREFRADRGAARRGRRARASPQPLRPRGYQLDRHHAAAEAAHVLHPELFAGLGDLSLSDGQPGLFLRRHAARRPDADRIRLQQRADRAVLFRLGLPVDRAIPRGGHAVVRIRGRHRGRPRSRAQAAGHRGVAAPGRDRDFDRSA